MNDAKLDRIIELLEEVSGLLKEVRSDQPKVPATKGYRQRQMLDALAEGGLMSVKDLMAAMGGYDRASTHHLADKLVEKGLLAKYGFSPVRYGLAP